MTPAFRVYWCVMNKWGGGDVKFPPNINKAEDTVTKIKRPSCFDLKQIAESGQCFRFKMLMSDRHGVMYSVVYKDNYLEIEQPVDEDVLLISCDMETWNSVWVHYFDLENDYEKYLRTIESLDGRYDYIKKASRVSSGIRILNQDAFEMLISFIISQRNNIPRICASVETLARTYGEQKQDKFTGMAFWTFPTEFNMPIISGEYAELGFGYRDAYLAGAVKAVQNYGIEAFNSKEKVLSLKGVGEKVANCYCLFGLHQLGMFPVDVWIQRIIDNYFNGVIDITPFEEFAGVAQQYMFYYERLTSGKM